jgi:hypothetical protein
VSQAGSGADHSKDAVSLPARAKESKRKAEDESFDFLATFERVDLEGWISTS